MALLNSRMVVAILLNRDPIYASLKRRMLAQQTIVVDQGTELRK